MKIVLTVELEAELGHAESTPEERNDAAEGVCRQLLYATPGYAKILTSSCAVDGGPSFVVPAVR